VWSKKNTISCIKHLFWWSPGFDHDVNCDPIENDQNENSQNAEYKQKAQASRIALLRDRALNAFNHYFENTVISEKYKKS
jgi:hypothetical protein